MKTYDLRKNFSVGYFLATREIKRNNPWSTALVIFVMSLTFLNMILMGGILIGLAEGMMNSFKRYYSSDVLIKPAIQNKDISETSLMKNVIKALPSYKALSIRYTSSAVLENKEKVKIRETDIKERVSGTLVGINPKDEDNVTGISAKVIEGNFFNEYATDEVVLGKSLLAKYSKGASTEPRLENIQIGSKLTLSVNEIKTDVTVIGIVDTGNTTVDSRIFISENTMRNLISNQSLNASEIAVSILPSSSDIEAKEYINANFPYPSKISIETGEEALPKAIRDMKKTFSMLGNMVGAISVIVGAITIFIVIFVNAITRRKYIGILKGIGISAQAIEISYVLQSVFYALSGITIASLLVIIFLKPWFVIHPLKFPVTEGQLAVTSGGLIIRGIILLLTAFISGYVPALMVTKQNTLDAILGR
ncbi:hypothetical protein B6D29_03100 [Microgenomates bacterium UTCPR1]|nr:MAG: hypothetical protein B6D29_03100 [Microgenomates bacterium UTCPR1]